MTMYNWKEELDSCLIDDDSLPTKELYDLREYASKEIAKKIQSDPAAVLEQLWGEELSLWAIRTTSMLYQLLGSWYGCNREMEERIRNSFYYSNGKGRFFCFASYGGKNFLDHDLFGGDYTTKCYIAFGNFVDRFMENLPDGPEYSNEIEDPDAEKRFNERIVNTAEKAIRAGLLSPLAAVRLAPGVVAAKVWTRDDIRDGLQTEGYEGTEEQIDRVIGDSDFLGQLEYCTDQDWDIVRQAVEAAHIWKPSGEHSND